MNGSKLRVLMSVLVTSLLGLGYAASQYFYLIGKPVEYAALVDQPSVRMLMLVILIAVIALAVSRKDEVSA
jgi:hypothetical protein